jgi:hypothetical protein
VSNDTRYRNEKNPLSDTDLLRQILGWTRTAASWQSERFKIEFLRYWTDELDKPRNCNPKRLLRYGFKTYSQNDEDGIIQEIFRRIGTTNRQFVEFGVQKGFECNTAKLLVEGWHGLWIEADAKPAGQIREHFWLFLADSRLTLLEAKVTAENINSLLEKAGVPEAIDFLSVDIDFNDYWIWKSIEIVRPRVVCIEYNTSLRPPLSLVVPYQANGRWTGGNYFGASLEALVRLGRAKGYRIVGCCFAGVNAFFVREELCGDLFVEPATAEEHYEPDRYFARYMPAGHQGRPGPYETV